MLCDGSERDGRDAMQEWQDGNMNMLKVMRTDEFFSLSSPWLSCFPSAEHCSEFCCALMMHDVCSCCAISNSSMTESPKSGSLRPRSLSQPGFASLMSWGVCQFHIDVGSESGEKPWCKNDPAATDLRKHHKVVCGVHGAVPQDSLDCWVFLCVRAMGFLSPFLQKAAETEI